MSQIGEAYGNALFSLAKEDQNDSLILSQLEALNESFTQNPEFLKLLSSYNLSPAEHMDIIDQCFGNSLHKYLLNTIKLLTEKRHVSEFASCVQSYKESYNTDHNILEVKAVTAVPLTETQMERLIEKLKNISGKTISIHNVVDPECLGGIRLDYDGKQVEDTVSARLASIRNMLKSMVF